MQRTHNSLTPGSNPGGPTNIFPAGVMVTYESPKLLIAVRICSGKPVYADWEGRVPSAPNTSLPAVVQLHWSAPILW